MQARGQGQTQETIAAGAAGTKHRTSVPNEIKQEICGKADQGDEAQSWPETAKDHDLRISSSLGEAREGCA